MPIYNITDERTGRTLMIRAHRPLTPDEVDEVFTEAFPHEPEPEISLGRKIAAGAVRVAAPVVGGLIGTGLAAETGPGALAGTAAGFAAGSALGETLAQKIEGRGLRPKRILTETAIGGALGLVPGLGPAKTLAGSIGKGVVEGAYFGGAGYTLGELLEGRRPELAEAAKHAAFGAVLGGGIRGVAHKLGAKQEPASGATESGAAAESGGPLAERTVEGFAYPIPREPVRPVAGRLPAQPERKLLPAPGLPEPPATSLLETELREARRLPEGAAPAPEPPRPPEPPVPPREPIPPREPVPPRPPREPEPPRPPKSASRSEGPGAAAAAEFERGGPAEQVQRELDDFMARHSETFGLLERILEAGGIAKPGTSYKRAYGERVPPDSPTSVELLDEAAQRVTEFADQLNQLRRRIEREPVDAEFLRLFRQTTDLFEGAYKEFMKRRGSAGASLRHLQDIYRSYEMMGLLPKVKERLPVLEQLWKDLRERRTADAAADFLLYLRMNLFTVGSFTLDFTTNGLRLASQLPASLAYDAVNMISGTPSRRFMGTCQAIANWLRLTPEARENWLRNPHGLSDEILAAGRRHVAGGEQVATSAGKGVMVSGPADYFLAAPVRAKMLMDYAFYQVNADIEAVNRAWQLGKRLGLEADELSRFIYHMKAEPSAELIQSFAPAISADEATKLAKEFKEQVIEFALKGKFDRPLASWMETISRNKAVQAFVEAYPRWTFQFSAWAAEMLGLKFITDAAGKPALRYLGRTLLHNTKLANLEKATPAELAESLMFALSGWGAVYFFHRTMYDNVDFRTMELVREDGSRVRLSGRTPAPELAFLVAALRGDWQKAKAALPYLSVPGAKMLGGQPGGVISPFIDAVSDAMKGRYTAEMASQEFANLINNAIPGKSVLNLIRAVYDPTLREGIGAPVPGVAEMLPQKINITTGEPSAPKQRLPFTSIEVPTIGGVPVPGAARVTNPIEAALLEHGFGLTRPRRTPLLDLPAEDVSPELRREYEKLAGQMVNRILGPLVQSARFKALPFETRRELIQNALSEARSAARQQLSMMYARPYTGTKSPPIALSLLPTNR